MLEAISGRSVWRAILIFAGWIAAGALSGYALKVLVFHALGRALDERLPEVGVGTGLLVIFVGLALPLCGVFAGVLVAILAVNRGRREMM